MASWSQPCHPCRSSDPLRKAAALIAGGWPPAVGAAIALAAIGAAFSPTVRAQTGLDWASVGPALTDHDGWGVRGIVPASADGRALLREVWAASAPNATVLLPTGGAPVAAIGVSSPHDQAVLDARVWHLVNRSPTRIEPQDLPGSGPASERLLVPPAELSATGSWPPGTYQLDLLVGRRVVTITVVLPPPPRDPATAARIATEAAALPAGPFSVTGSDDATTVRHVDAVTGSPLSAGVAWLDATTDDPLTARTATIEGSPPLVGLGLHGAPGEHITNAVLFNQSPPIIPIRTTAATVTASAEGDIAVFDPGPAGVSPGVYRIDSSWVVDGQPVARSWHLDIRGPQAEAGDPPLLEAARALAGAAGAWQVVEDGSPASAQQPTTTPRDISALGSECAGGSSLAAGQPVIGVGHSGARISSVSARRLATDGSSETVAVADSLDPVPGLVLLTPFDSPTWTAGTYEVMLMQGTQPRYLAICVR